MIFLNLVYLVYSSQFITGKPSICILIFVGKQYSDVFMDPLDLHMSEVVGYLLLTFNFYNSLQFFL